MRFVKDLFIHKFKLRKFLVAKQFVVVVPFADFGANLANSITRPPFQICARFLPSEMAGFLCWPNQWGKNEDFRKQLGLEDI